MMSRFRQPFPWEAAAQLQPVESSNSWTPPVILPAWGSGPPTGGEHNNARQGIERMAKRHFEHARKQGISDYTYEEAMAEGRKCAYRYDDRNN